MKLIILLSALAATFFISCEKDSQPDSNAKICVQCNIKTTMKITGYPDQITTSELKACDWTNALLDSYLTQGNLSTSSSTNGVTATYKTETTCTKRDQ